MDCYYFMYEANVLFLFLMGLYGCIWAVKIFTIKTSVTFMTVWPIVASWERLCVCVSERKSFIYHLYSMCLFVIILLWVFISLSHILFGLERSWTTNIHWFDENPSVHADLRPLHYILLWPWLRVRKHIYYSYKTFYVGKKEDN